jgi:hypothetical protein
MSSESEEVETGFTNEEVVERTGFSAAVVEESR